LVKNPRLLKVLVMLVRREPDPIKQRVFTYLLQNEFYDIQRSLCMVRGDVGVQEFLDDIDGHELLLVPLHQLQVFGMLDFEDYWDAHHMITKVMGQ